VNEVLDYSQITKRCLREEFFKPYEKKNEEKIRFRPWLVIQGIQGRMGSGNEQSLSLNIAHSAPSKERFNI